MPRIVRGDVHWCDFGPVIGSELSGRRPALIISNSELNRRLSVATVLPMSTTTPSGRHMANHVFIESADSWSSVRQIKTVAQNTFGPRIATAASQEMERILEILVARLASVRRKPRTIQTSSGDEWIFPGTIWRVTSEQTDREPDPRVLLILDYNEGNQIALAVAVEFNVSRTSPLRVPVHLADTGEAGSVLVHRVTSLDTRQRPMIRIGVLDEDSRERVNSRFLATIDG